MVEAETTAGVAVAEVPPAAGIVTVKPIHALGDIGPGVVKFAADVALLVVSAL